MNEGARQANEDMWRRQMLAELTAIKNTLQREEPKSDSLQQLKAEILPLLTDALDEFADRKFEHGKHYLEQAMAKLSAV